MMKLKPLSTRFIFDSDELNKVLLELIETAESIFISSAWVSHKTDAYRLLLKHKDKISKFYCGISGFNTTPEVLKDFALPYENFWVVNDLNLFHHKCFIFKLKDSRGVFKHKILTGSANFTYSGLNENYEIMQLTEFDSLINLEDQISSTLSSALIQVDAGFIVQYQERYRYSLMTYFRLM